MNCTRAHAAKRAGQWACKIMRGNHQQIGVERDAYENKRHWYTLKRGDRRAHGHTEPKKGRPPSRRVYRMVACGESARACARKYGFIIVFRCTMHAHVQAHSAHSRSLIPLSPSSRVVSHPSREKRTHIAQAAGEMRCKIINSSLARRALVRWPSGRRSRETGTVLVCFRK